jgi:hypothetical protein
MIFIFFVEGGVGGGGVLWVLIGGSELEWEMQRTGWGGSTGCIMHRVHTNIFIIHHDIYIKMLGEITLCIFYKTLEIKRLFLTCYEIMTYFKNTINIFP